MKMLLDISDSQLIIKCETEQEKQAAVLFFDTVRGTDRGVLAHMDWDHTQIELHCVPIVDQPDAAKGVSE